MKTARTEWLIWLQFSTLFLLLFPGKSKIFHGYLLRFKIMNKREANISDFSLPGVSASGKPCEELLRSIKLPAHTGIAHEHRTTNHVTFLCDKGYYFSDGRNTKDVSCMILKNDQIPQCTGIFGHT